VLLRELIDQQAGADAERGPQYQTPSMLLQVRVLTRAAAIGRPCTNIAARQWARGRSLWAVPHTELQSHTLSRRPRRDIALWHTA
jgi:hypothetical protein